MGDHKKRTEIAYHKKKLIMRVQLEDFLPHIKGYTETMSEDYVLKNPVTYSNRVTAIKFKIYNATGIPPHQLDILNLSISTKRVKLCWVTFSSERTVSEIFRLSMINGNAREFNAFPHIPAKAMCRKEDIEKILKLIQAINTQLRYQVRMRDDDLVVKVKYSYKDDYQPYRTVRLADIDPNDTVRDWDLTTVRRKESAPPVSSGSSFNWQVKAGKKNASQSPESREAKSTNREQIDDWQVAEFIHAFLEGTATKPRYANLDWQAEARTELTEQGGATPGAELHHGAVPQPEHGAAPIDSDSNI